MTNQVLNYLLEANIGLCVFIGMYWLLMRRETDFKLKRVSLLLSVICAITFPLIHWNTQASPVPSLGDVLPAYWLPDITVGTQAIQRDVSITVWDYISITYAIGMLVSMLLFVYRLLHLIVFSRTLPVYPVGRFNIAESTLDMPSFSFFNFIFIGQADKMSEYEKRQIIRHEMVHSQCWHSLDILFMNITGIFFWFNPIIRVYKKTFIQVHEFEADARAVQNRNVDDYCSLLARVALLSADIKLANHFNHSLTLKRIEMMRTMKMKPKLWKIAAMGAILPMFFYTVACQDQVTGEDIQNVANSSTMALDVPAEVQKRLNELEATKPGQKFVVIEVTSDEGKASLDKFKPEQISSMNIVKTNDKRDFAILELNDATRQAIASANGNNGAAFTVVEEMPEPEGGLPALYQYIMTEITYPAEARKNGTEGNVFVSFIVELDGTLTDVKVIKGVDPLLDAEALRVMQGHGPKWTAGKQNNESVRVKMVIPIKFALAGGSSDNSTKEGVTVIGHKKN